MNDYGRVRCYMHPQACAFHYWRKRGTRSRHRETPYVARLRGHKFTVKRYTLRTGHILAIRRAGSEEIRSMNLRISWSTT
ncbi:MAG: hypothetical protein ACLR5G_14420 [Eubacteriales bacterium]